MRNPFFALIATFTVFSLPGCSLVDGPPTCRVDSERGVIRYHLYAAILPVRHRVILAPGFLRSPETMDHLAHALAQGGVEVAAIDLKRSKPWAGNHDENARDMTALREALGWDRVAYAGFSAGGLSALLAAAGDKACDGLLMLDPVDNASLGLRAAPQVRVPSLAILGQPGPDNAWRNGAAMLAEIPKLKIIEMPEARHPDFETRTAFPLRAASHVDLTHQRINDHAVAWILESCRPASFLQRPNPTATTTTR